MSPRVRETHLVVRWQHAGLKHAEAEFYFDGEFCGVLTLNKGQRAIFKDALRLRAPGGAPVLRVTHEEAEDLFS